MSTSFGFKPRSAEDDLLAEFFGSLSPSGGMGGGMRGTRFSGGSGGMHQGGLRKGPLIENKLPCSLEDLYKGTTKKMKITREIADTSRRTKTVEKILTIDIKPGWKKGTKITFSEKGNEHPRMTPADLVFVIDEKPHKLFTRDGNDLIYTQKISLAEALTGHTVNITTLDGRILTIPINSVISPGYEQLVEKKGMPIPKTRLEKET